MVMAGLTCGVRIGGWWAMRAAVVAALTLPTIAGCTPLRHQQQRGRSEGAGVQARGGARPLTWDAAANRVIGQADMSHPFANRPDARGLFRPVAVAVDASTTPYRLWVTDAGNHRVLGYSQPSQPDRMISADLLLGQADALGAFSDETAAARDRLLDPSGLTSAGTGDLWVADAGHNRVLRFNRPFETDVLADYVYGQAGSFDTLGANQGGLSANSLAEPRGMCIAPNGDRWIADTGNHRVLRYHMHSGRTTTAANVVGQPDMCSGQSDAERPSRLTLHYPAAVAASGEYLYVADTGYARMLVYQDAPFTPLPTHVYGQNGLFDTAEVGCSPYRLAGPTALAALPDGRFLVADTPNHRVLLFDRPGSLNQQPLALWGQGSDLHRGVPNRGGVGAGSLHSPMGIAVAPDNTLWLADRDNNRVLGFLGGIDGDREADIVIGQMDMNHATPNFVDGLGLSEPRDVALDRSSRPNRLYICDRDNNRILAYANAAAADHDTPADLVIGQPDAHSNQAGVGRTALCRPNALAVDHDGNLFVADSDNNRVLRFDDPFGTDVVADGILGQPTYDDNAPNPAGASARTLHRPSGLAIDAAGNLYVADTRNHRVLRFDRPVVSDDVADAVWGQAGRYDTGRENGGGGPRADTFSYPMGLDIDARGRLAVADTANHRVLLFDTRAADPLTARRVIGQAGAFDQARDNRGGCSAESLSGPEDVRFVAGGLLVADTANCRVLYYANPLRDNVAAGFVFGQEGRFDRGNRPLNATNAHRLWFPSGMDLDTAGRLYVADRGHNRVLVYDAIGRR